MPTNLHALIRYRTIDRCLQRTTRIWTWAKLAEACQQAIQEQTGRDIDPPSRRTILQDIAFMRQPDPGFNAPIFWDRKQRTYRYTTPGFSIFEIPLSDLDLSELRHALNIMQQYRSFDQLEHFAALLTRLEERIELGNNEDLPSILFETNEQATGLRWLNELYHHIRNQRCLHLEYRPFDPDRHEQYVFSPYLLKEYHNRWFLIGHNHVKQKTWTLALDRIMSISPHTNNSYYRDPAFRAENWFRDIIGVTILDGVDKVEVIIRASAIQARYLETKPLHHTQQIIQRHVDYTDFAYQLRPNYELEARLLSLGERVEVLQPDSLRRQIQQRLQLALQHYL